MNPTMRVKLEHLLDRQEEINALLSDPTVIAHQDSFRDLSIELADISPIVEHFQRYQILDGELSETRSMLEDGDPSIRRMAHDEMPRLQSELEQSQQALRKLLIPRDPNDERNIFLEVRAGTGGDEAALFAGDLFRMYNLYAEKRNWRVEVVSQSPGEHGGYKEIIGRVAGRGAYSQLKFESGAHRVQRVPETEAQGRIHTSACTVAVMPEADEIDDVERWFHGSCISMRKCALVLSSPMLDVSMRPWNIWLMPHPSRVMSRCGCTWHANRCCVTAASRSRR